MRSLTVTTIFLFYLSAIFLCFYYISSEYSTIEIAWYAGKDYQLMFLSVKEFLYLCSVMLVFGLIAAALTWATVVSIEKIQKKREP